MNDWIFWIILNGVHLQCQQFRQMLRMWPPSCFFFVESNNVKVMPKTSSARCNCDDKEMSKDAERVNMSTHCRESMRMRPADQVQTWRSSFDFFSPVTCGSLKFDALAARFQVVLTEWYTLWNMCIRKRRDVYTCLHSAISITRLKCYRSID